MKNSQDKSKQQRRDAKAAVHGPATFLLVLSAGGIIFAALLCMLGIGGLIDPPANAVGNVQARSAVAAVLGLIGFPCYVFIGWGAFQMDKLGNYKTARIASTLAVLPVHPSWPLFLIGGLMAKTALNKPEVRAEFAQDDGGTVDDDESRDETTDEMT